METYRSAENKKKFLLSKIRPFEETVASDGSKTQILQTYVDYSSAELIARYLASKRPFSQSFDVYLKHVSYLLIIVYIYLLIYIHQNHYFSLIYIFFCLF